MRNRFMTYCNMRLNGGCRHSSCRTASARRRGCQAPPEYLLRVMRRSVVTRTGRGLYRMADAKVTEQQSSAEVAKRLPNATVCPLSSLVFLGITTPVSGKSGWPFHEV